MPTSTLDAVSHTRRRRLRVALPVTMLAFALAVVPAVAGPYDDEIADLRTDIVGQEAAIASQQDLLPISLPTGSPASPAMRRTSSTWTSRSSTPMF